MSPVTRTRRSAWTKAPRLARRCWRAWGRSVYGSVAEACKAVVEVKFAADPCVTNHAAYDKFYKVYQNLYAHLKDDFADIAKLVS